MRTSDNVANFGEGGPGENRGPDYTPPQYATGPQFDSSHARIWEPTGRGVYHRKYRVEFAEGDNSAIWKIQIYRQVTLAATLVNGWDGTDSRETGPRSHWFTKDVNFDQDIGDTYALIAWFKQGNTWYQLFHYPQDSPTEKFSVTGLAPIDITFFYGQ